MTYAKRYLITDKNTDQHPELSIRVQRRIGLQEGEQLRPATPEEEAECERLDQSQRDFAKRMDDDKDCIHNIEHKEYERLSALPYEVRAARIDELQASLKDFVEDRGYRHEINPIEVGALLCAYDAWSEQRKKDHPGRQIDPSRFFQAKFGLFGGPCNLDPLTIPAFYAELRRRHIASRPIDRDTLLGTFEVTGSALRVSDPCYDKDTWCSGVVKDVLPGRWIGKCRYAVDWGLRSYYVAAFHDESLPEAALGQSLIPITPDGLSAAGWEPLDVHVGVDSGQAGVFDEAHYRDGSVITQPPAFSPGETDPAELWYGSCCDATLGETGAGVIPHGVVSGSGNGDGGYAAYVRRNKDGKVIAVMIDFLGSCSPQEDADE